MPMYVTSLLFSHLTAEKASPVQYNTVQTKDQNPNKEIRGGTELQKTKYKIKSK